MCCSATEAVSDARVPVRFCYNDKINLNARHSAKEVIKSASAASICAIANRDRW